MRLLRQRSAETRVQSARDRAPAERDATLATNGCSAVAFLGDVTPIGTQVFYLGGVGIAPSKCKMKRRGPSVNGKNELSGERVDF